MLEVNIVFYYLLTHRNLAMRSNKIPYDYKRKLTFPTPLCDKFLALVGKEETIQIGGVFYKVVDKSRIAGTTVIEFYLQKTKG